MTLELTSPAFAHRGAIPSQYTCEGANVSPPLAWRGAPRGTQAYALLVDDPDAPDPSAPKVVWVHWVLYNLPASSTGLPGGVAALPAGTLEGVNDWKRTGYGGPCPPVGRHRYFFKLYALKAPVPALHAPTKDQLLAAMTPLVLAQAELVGTYQKGG